MRSCGLTNSVYPPRRDASQGARTQTRRINLVGLNRRPEDGRVGDKGVCKLRARVHTQIMTGDLPSVLICAIGFASIARANECAARLRAIQARTRPCGPRQMALQTGVDPFIVPDGHGRPFEGRTASARLRLNPARSPEIGLSRHQFNNH